MRTRRALMFTALPALAVLAVLGVVLAINHRDAAVEDRQRESRELAVAAAVNATRFLDDQFAILATVAANPTVRDARLEEMQPYFVDVAMTGRFSSGVGYIDAEGVSRVSSNPLPPGTPPVSVADRPYFQEAIQGRPAVSDALLGKVRKRPVLVFGYPVGGKQPTGVVSAGLALDEVGEGVQRLLYAPGADVRLLDGAGNTVVGPRPVRGLEPAPSAYPLDRLRREESGIVDDADGRLLAFAAVPDTNLIAVVDRERGDVIGPLDRALVLEVAAILVLLGLGVLLTFAMGRRLDRLQHEQETALDEQREIALRLQESLLPGLRVPEGVVAAAGYVPAQGRMAVGGDWYDLVDMEDGRIALSVGDVAGHGLQAAATMGKLRSATRAEALRRAEPVEALEQLDRFAALIKGQPLATVLYGVLDLRDGHFSYATAGHPPPLLLRAEGNTELLEGGRSSLLGIGPEPPARTSAEVWLSPGDTLIAYTDGVVETPGSTIDTGMAELAGRARSIGADPQRLAAELLAAVPEPRRDDAAVLAVRLEGVTKKPVAAGTAAATGSKAL